jgi:hypothetical protein
MGFGRAAREPISQTPCETASLHTEPIMDGEVERVRYDRKPHGIEQRGFNGLKTEEVSPSCLESGTRTCHVDLPTYRALPHSLPRVYDAPKGSGSDRIRFDCLGFV